MYTQLDLYTLYIDIRYIKWYTYIKCSVLILTTLRLDEAPLHSIFSL